MKKIAVAQMDEPVQSVALSTGESMLAGALTLLKERVTAALNEAKKPEPPVHPEFVYGKQMTVELPKKFVMKKTKFPGFGLQKGLVKLTGALFEESPKYLLIKFPGKASAWYKKPALEAFEKSSPGQVTVTVTPAYAKRRGLL